MAELTRSKWGPHLWTALHVMSVAGDSPNALRIILEQLQEALPCPECREHYTRYVREHPPNFEIADDAVQWLYDLHNAVNDRLGKRDFEPWEFKERYGVSVSPSAFSSKSKRLQHPAARGRLSPATLGLLLPGLMVPGLGLLSSQSSFRPPWARASARQQRSLRR